MTISPSPQAPQPTWTQNNRQVLMAAVNRVRQTLEQKVANVKPQAAASETDSLHPPAFSEQPDGDIKIESASVLATLCQHFNLSSFECKILLLCAGIELSQAFGPLCAAFHGNPQQTYPTFGLAFALFTEGDWAAITPEAPLRRWQMIEVLAGAELTGSPLRIDEHILHKLMGIRGLDSRLKGLVKERSHIKIVLPPSQHQIAEQISRTGLSSKANSPVVQLWGGDSETREAIATVAAANQERSLHIIDAAALPTDRNQLTLLKTLWERESIFAQSTLLFNCNYLPTLPDNDRAQMYTLVSTLIEQCQRSLIITSSERFSQRQRPLISIELSPPTPLEQRQLWRTHLGEDITHSLNGHVDKLVTYFNLDSNSIKAVCEQVNPDRNDLETRLWQSCLSQAQPQLGNLAQKIFSSAHWDDLVLPDAEFKVVKTIEAHLKQKTKVYETWGFSQRSPRGLGISALFAGASGTGKTLAAETLANALKLDLYRIDLSAVVSKYIGETEKNLRRIFDSAEKGGAILLFDEADALFGKRSEVKDARDRYANMEVAYLLQRIEAYRGLAILTTNLKDSLDQAFLRRIRFVVQFPFPDATQREKIWRLSFPKQMPLGDLNFKTLAKLNIAGGNIRNIALNSAFLAAEAQEKTLKMKRILEAAQSEYIKLERPLTELSGRELDKYSEG